MLHMMLPLLYNNESSAFLTIGQSKIKNYLTTLCIIYLIEDLTIILKLYWKIIQGYTALT